jgi:hypothetical protein
MTCMTTTYLHSVKNYLFSLKPLKANRWLLVAFLFFNLFFASTVFAQNGPNCSSGICIGPGTAISAGSLTVTSNAFYSSITVKAGATLTVKSGFTLYVGQVGTPATTEVVDFQNGCFVIIETGASLVVNGRLNNSNNSNGVTFDGTVTVTGNVTAGNGSTIVGAGTLDTTGTIVTDNTGSIFGSTGDCISGPCSGSQLNCSGTTNTISGNQTICSGNNPAVITGSTINPATYQWQSSTTSGANFIDISGATIANYSPGSLSVNTYYRRKQTVGGCTGTSNQVTVTVTALPPSPTGTATQSFCSGATVANLVAGGTTIKWYLAASGGTALTPTTALVNGIYYATQTIGSCENSTRFAVTATVSPTTVGGIVSGGTTICSGNTSGTLTLSGQTGTVVKWQSSVSPFSTWTDIANTATTYTSGALTQTTQFRAVVKSGTCLEANSVFTTVTISSSKTWTGTTSSSWFTPTNWSCGSVPIADSDVIIENVTNKPIVDDSSKIALANTLIVNSGSSLTVNSGNTLKVTDKVTNNSGTITFEDSASLVQTNNITNSGNIIYKRYANIRNTDYTYWSSPVAEYTLGGVSRNKTLSDKYYSYNSTIDNWQQASASTVMTPGLGYIIRGPEPTTTPPLPPPPGLYEAPFVGVPNNGNIQVPVIYSNTLGLSSTDPNFGVSYLLGNPYPSALDAETFLDINESVLGGTIYFWTHNTALDEAKNVTNPDPNWAYTYSLNDYAAYNAVGGVGVGLGTAATSGGSAPNGKIAAGQGFFATGIATGTVNFTNAMRLAGTTNSEGTGTNQQFFKTKNPTTKTSKVIEKNRIWLNLSNTQGAFKQALIGYVTDATNDYDSRFDGESFDGNEFVDFYSVNQDKNLTIQGRALPFDENDEIPLGYRIAVEGNFTINIDETDGLLANQNVFLEDKLANKTANLKEGKYTFNTAAGTFNDRFVLRYTDKTLGIAETDKEDEILVLYSNNYKSLIIHNNGTDSTVNKVTLYNMTGQNIANWDINDNGQTNIQIPIKNIDSGIYIVKVETTKGESNKKIIIR